MLSVLFTSVLYFGLDIPIVLSIIFGLVIALATSASVAYLSVPAILSPLHSLWQAILHVSPSSHDVPPPNLDKLRIGRELVTNLAHQVYQLAQNESNSNKSYSENTAETPKIPASSVITNLPIPFLVCNKQRALTLASNSAIEYCHMDKTHIFNRPLFDNLKLEFASEATLEKWMDTCEKDKITDRKYWERVRIRVPDKPEPLLCDLAAYYDRDNPNGTEFIITLFDRTEHYQQDDQSINFVAMAVHELRTPLTILRGYIEVFEDELADKLDPELKGFMSKMHVSAEQLTSFVNNILNVSRIDNDQLELTLGEEDWGELIKHIVEDNNLRANVHGKNITLNITPGIPKVAVDKVSIYEVVSNLLDNAIKYSAKSKEIIVTTKVGEGGLVETTIQDFGVGIPSSVLPNLFEKFYRNHRTRDAVGGTGLGLYLSKAIVNAHGGQIWATSHETGGSTFGFSLQQYSQVASNMKDNNSDITRAAHGWVKNHSLYRR